MPEPLTIIVLGEPIAAGRHRSTRGRHSYIPPKTRSERQRIKDAGAAAMNGREMFAGAVRVEHRVEKLIPTSVSKKRRALMLLNLIRPITRPDFDNYSKMLDALNTIVWRDDSQVVDYRFQKVYSQQPKIVLTIFDLVAGNVEE
jgi:Holliday junction resolvase RusA-like endonuclease